MNATARGLRVLVTAGAAGIGKAFAETFADAGAKVFICDVDQAALAAFRAARPEIGGGIADVADPRHVDGLFDAATVFLGDLDLLHRRRRPGDARVVDQYVEAAEEHRCRIEQPIDVPRWRRSRS